MTIDIKIISIWVGLAASLSGIVATWAITQYRLDALEERQKITSDELKNLAVELNKKGDEVRCLICDAHKIDCPGC